MAYEWQLYLHDCESSIVTTNPLSWRSLYRFRYNSYFVSQDADDLDRKYTGVSIELESKYNMTRTSKKQADRLRDHASDLYKDTYAKIERLKGI